MKTQEEKNKIAYREILKKLNKCKVSFDCVPILYDKKDQLKTLDRLVEFKKVDEKNKISIECIIIGRNETYVLDPELAKDYLNKNSELICVIYRKNGK